MFLPALSVEELKKRLLSDYPTVSDLDKIAEISDGIPGIAEEIIKKEGLQLHESFLSLLRPESSVLSESVMNFSEEIVKDPVKVKLVRLFMLKFIAEMAKKSKILKGYDWSKFYAYIEKKWHQMDALYLDKAQSLTEMIFEIERRLV